MAKTLKMGSVDCPKKLLGIIFYYFSFHRAGKVDASVTREDIIYAKKLHDSCFHPDNGELMNVIGRMSFQVPGNVFLTGGMLTFYKLLFFTIFSILQTLNFINFFSFNSTLIQT